MKTPNSSPAFTSRQRRPADNGDIANPFTLSDRLHTQEARPVTISQPNAAAKAAATDAAAISAAVDAANAANAGWTIAAPTGKWANAALAAYDAANDVYRKAYGCSVDRYPSANVAAYKALDIIAFAVKK